MYCSTDTVLVVYIYMISVVTKCWANVAATTYDDMMMAKYLLFDDFGVVFFFFFCVFCSFTLLFDGGLHTLLAIK